MSLANESEATLIFEYRRPTETWVKVNLRRLRELGLSAAVLREGEPRRGAVVLKLHDGAAGWRVLSQVRAADGRLSWMAGLGGRATTEREAHDYLQRSVERDPDIWIVEIKQPDPRPGVAAACTPPLRTLLPTSG